MAEGRPVEITAWTVPEYKKKREGPRKKKSNVIQFRADLKKGITN